MSVAFQQSESHLPIEISAFFPFFTSIFHLSYYMYYVLLPCPSSLSISQHTLSFLYFYVFFWHFPSHVSLFICLLVLRWHINRFSHSRHFSLFLCSPFFIRPLVFLPPFESFLFSFLFYSYFTPPFLLRGLLVSTKFSSFLLTDAHTLKIDNYYWTNPIRNLTT